LFGFFAQSFSLWRNLIFVYMGPGLKWASSSFKLKPSVEMLVIVYIPLSPDTAYEGRDYNQHVLLVHPVETSLPFFASVLLFPFGFFHSMSVCFVLIPSSSSFYSGRN